MLPAAFAFFEDRFAEPGQPAAWLFLEPVREWHIRTADELALALAEVAQAGHWSVWALNYELGRLLEPALGGEAEVGAPPARFWAYKTCQVFDRAQLAQWWANHEPPAAAGVGGLELGTDEAAYRTAVQAIQDYIRAGDCYQVNFTFPLYVQTYGEVFDLYRRLRERQPVRYGGVIQHTAGCLISLSPELFVSRQGDRLMTRPMKGTARRHQDVHADREAAQGLAASAKDRAENLMIVDLLRNDLGRLAQPGSVQVSSLFAVESYPTVHQMVSQVEARVPLLGNGSDDLALLQALFPCGSITGAPKIRAMQIIEELESGPRGIYTGAVGWRSPEGELRLNVAIRTLDVQADGRGCMGVGSGIVADSEAGAEWQECLLKARFLTDLDPGLQLIETLRLEVRAGHSHFPRLERHRQRMSRSAAWLGFPWTPEAMGAALGVGPLPEGDYRVRLALDKSGQFEVRCLPLLPEPEGERLLVLAKHTIDERDPLRAHKTTARSLYDRALTAIAERPEVFDVLFLNQRGMVVEGARSNVFACIDGQWLTPPQAAGALPGVLREELLARGQVFEAELSLADLGRATEIRCGNALRGWVPVSLRPEIIV